MELWLAKDKNGTVHLSNIKLVKPSEMYPNNPHANDEIFIPVYNGYNKFGLPTFSMIIPDCPDEMGLTFENSPRKIKGFIFE